MKTLLASLSIILLFGSATCISQNITINTHRAKETYSVGPTKLTRKEVKQRIASDQAALDKFKSGQGWNIGGISVCVGASAVLLSGVGLAIDRSVNTETLAASQKVDASLSWTLVGVGIGALIPGAIMILHGRNQRIDAVKKYNQTVGGSAQVPLLIRPASKGIGLALVF